jgi:hypothetical protein
VAEMKSLDESKLGCELIAESTSRSSLTLQRKIYSFSYGRASQISRLPVSFSYQLGCHFAVPSSAGPVPRYPSPSQRHRHSQILNPALIWSPRKLLVIRSWNQGPRVYIFPVQSISSAFPDKHSLTPCIHTAVNPNKRLPPLGHRNENRRTSIPTAIHYLHNSTDTRYLTRLHNLSASQTSLPKFRNEYCRPLGHSVKDIDNGRYGLRKSYPRWSVPT